VIFSEKERKEEGEEVKKKKENVKILK